MCGITGIYQFNQDRCIDIRILEGITNTLMHRRPDDSGYYHENNIGLGFRRLSIIDLTHGNQPLFNEDKTVISVCNGEIYNFKELKSMLTSRGHRFYTNCDVEVLPHLYEEFGNDFLNRLN